MATGSSPRPRTRGASSALARELAAGAVALAALEANVDVIVVVRHVPDHGHDVRDPLVADARLLGPLEDDGLQALIEEDELDAAVLVARLREVRHQTEC